MRGKKSTYLGQYLSHEGSVKIRNYQYHGSDHSLVYKHVLTPMNNFLIEFVPRWMAPNLVRPADTIVMCKITLAGFLLVSLSHIGMAYFCPDMQGEAPWWMYLLCAIALFAYQVGCFVLDSQRRRSIIWTENRPVEPERLLLSDCSLITAAMH